MSIQFIPLLTIVSSLLLSSALSQQTIFKIGTVDGSSAEFDGAKEGFQGYVRRLGDRDKLFIVGQDDPSKSWTYLLPGVHGKWAGMGYWSWRVNFASLAMTLEESPQQPCFLVIDTAKVSKKPPIVRLEVNGYTQDINMRDLAGKKQLRFEIPAQFLYRGSNVMRLHSWAGDWLEFDAVSLVSNDKDLKLATPRGAVVENLYLAGKDRMSSSGIRQQAAVVDVINTQSNSVPLDIWVDGRRIETHPFLSGRQAWEVMLPSVTQKTKRFVQVKDKFGIVSERVLIQKPSGLMRLSDEVNLLAGTTNSRWMFTPGPVAPMSLMRLSPENEPARWKSGYDYQVESIVGFGHIHEWTMSGLLTMPHHGQMFLRPGDRFNPDSGWRSRIDPREAAAEVGKYAVTLKDTGIKAEMSVTKRSSLERYTYPKSVDPRIICSLQTGVDEYKTYINQVHLELVNNREIQGYSEQLNKGSNYPEKQDYTVYFVMQFDQPIKKLDGWMDGKLKSDIKTLDYKRVGKGLGDCGFAPVFDLPNGGVVHVRTGISLVDIEGANNNLQQEIEKPFGWDLEKLVEKNKNIWDALLGRFLIETRDHTRRSRFYTCLYRSLSGRGICSDADGRWRDASEKIQQTSGGLEMFSSDGVWGTHWNLNQLWNWVYPEVSKCFMDSQVQYFEKVGYTLKGPAGAEAIGVMLGSPEIPLMAGAWTAGVRPAQPKKLWQAVYHQQTTPGKKLPYGGFAGNEHYADYLLYGYIPEEGGGYGHYSSSTLEYAYQDWTAAQMAKEMKRPQEEIDLLTGRSRNWKNAIHPERLIVQFKNKKGEWTNKTHCVEGSPTQLRWHVPHDTSGLNQYFGGGDKAISILDKEFRDSEPMNFMAPADQMSLIKVNHGNQTMMHASYLFNAFGKPDLTQKWVRSILDRYYGYTPYDAYLGDEDQGQMSAWLNLASMGVFSIDGGVGQDSMVELIPPSFEKMRVKRPLGADWVISATPEVVNSGRGKSVTVNGELIKGFRTPLRHLLKKDGVVKIEWK